MDKLIKRVSKDIEKHQPAKAKKDIKVLLKADKKQDKLLEKFEHKKMKGK